MLDGDGAVLAANDDHTDADRSLNADRSVNADRSLNADFHLNIFDSRITDFTVTDSGEYRLAVRDYLGRGGALRVDVRRVDE